MFPSLIILIDLGLLSSLIWCTTCQYSPFADSEIVGNQLYQLDVHKFMGPDGIYARVLKELLGSTGPLSVLVCVQEESEGRPDKL